MNKPAILTLCAVLLSTAVFANVTVKGDKYTVDQFGASKGVKAKGISSKTEEVTLKDSSPSVKQSCKPLIR